MNYFAYTVWKCCISLCTRNVEGWHCHAQNALGSSLNESKSDSFRGHEVKVASLLTVIKEGPGNDSPSHHYSGQKREGHSNWANDTCTYREGYGSHVTVGTVLCMFPLQSFFSCSEMADGNVSGQKIWYHQLKILLSVTPKEQGNAHW